MPWEASTDFNGVRPPGFPGSIPVGGTADGSGWLPAQIAATTGYTGRAWTRLPWDPSNLSGAATEIREQGGWGHPAYGEACSDHGKKYATLTISGTASRLVVGGSCEGQIDEQRDADAWASTWDWTFETTDDDPETEEIDEAAYEVRIATEVTGGFTRTVNSWTPAGMACTFEAGDPVEVDPDGPNTPSSGTTANWIYPTVAGFAPSASLSYTLSGEVTTTTMATLLTAWLAESDAFRAATMTGGSIYQTESADASRGVVGRGRVRFALLADIPGGYKAVVDYVIRENYPVDRLSGMTAASLWHDGTGSITLTEPVNTSSDDLGEWTRGSIATTDVDEAPWRLSVGNSTVTANSNGDDGDCGLAVRVVSLAAGRRFRLACNMDWNADGDSGDHDFTMTMDEEPGELPRSPTVYWTDHAPDEVSSLGFRFSIEPGHIEEWRNGAWVAVPTEDILDVAAIIGVAYKARGGGPWGFRNFDPEEGDPPTPAWYSKAEISVDWQMAGTNPDPCGDDPTGDLILLGDVRVDAAGRLSDAITTDTADFGPKDFNPDSNQHPDARHPWYLEPPSYLLTRMPMTTPSDNPAEADLDPPAKDTAGDPFDQGVEVRRDLPQGWGSEVSRTAIDLTPSDDPETLSEWVTPPAWPAAGQFAVWENLRYEPAS